MFGFKKREYKPDEDWYLQALIRQSTMRQMANRTSIIKNSLEQIIPKSYTGRDPADDYIVVRRKDLQGLWVMSQLILDLEEDTPKL